MAEFSKELLEEADQLTLPSLSDRPVVNGSTIDRKYTQMPEDAVQVDLLENGDLTYHVTLSDPTSIPVDSLVAQEAFNRMTSVTRGGTVEPMLPPSLTSRLFTLEPMLLRPAFTVSLTFDPSTFERKTYSINRTAFRSTSQHEHRSAGKIIDYPYSTFAHGHWLATQLAKRRIGGSSASTLQHKYFRANENLSMMNEQEHSSKRFISEIVIQTRLAVAEWAVKNGVVIPFYNHELTTHGFELKEQGLLEQQRHAGKVFRKTKFSSENRGFASQNLAASCRLAALREYVGLVTLWQIGAHLDGLKQPFNRQQIEEICENANRHMYGERRVEKVITVGKLISQIDRRGQQAITKFSSTEIGTLLDFVIEHNGGDSPQINALAFALRKGLVSDERIAKALFAPRQEYDPSKIWPPVVEGTEADQLRRQQPDELDAIRQAALQHVLSKEPEYALKIIDRIKHQHWTIRQDEFVLPHASERLYFVRFRVEGPDSNWMCSLSILPASTKIEAQHLAAKAFLVDYVNNQLISTAPLESVSGFSPPKQNVGTPLSKTELEIAQKYGLPGQLVVRAHRYGWRINNKYTEPNTDDGIVSELRIAVAGSKNEITAQATGPNQIQAYSNAVRRLLAQIKDSPIVSH